MTELDGESVFDEESLAEKSERKREFAHSQHRDRVGKPRRGREKQKYERDLA